MLRVLIGDLALYANCVPFLSVSDLQKCSASASIFSIGDCAKKHWHLAIAYANLFGNLNGCTIFTKSDRDQKIVLWLQSGCGSMHE
jgi:hypothetical protein